jgi:hypothetical protein
MNKMKLKPETVKRLAAQHKAERIARRRNLEAELAEKAKQQPEGIWAELLTELRAKNGEN